MRVSMNTAVQGLIDLKLMIDEYRLLVVTPLDDVPTDELRANFPKDIRVASSRKGWIRLLRIACHLMVACPYSNFYTLFYASMK